MTEEQVELARLCVQMSAWRWLPGMKVSEGFRVTESLAPFMFPVDIPDLADPATGGAMLELLGQERWRINLCDGSPLAEACARVMIEHL
jgi:hypothetical protein